MTKFLNHTRIKTVVGENGNYGKWEILGRITYYPESFTGPTIEFTKPDGYFEIHTSCSYELYLGQTFGPRSEIIVSGYCLSNNLGGQFAECSYSDLPVPGK